MTDPPQKGLTTWFQSSDIASPSLSSDLDAWQPAHIYGCLQRSTVTRVQFMTFFARNQHLLLASSQNRERS